MIGASHPFQQRSLNALDENGNEGCARCGRTRDVHPGPVAVTPGPPPRDHYREQVHREFTGWAEAQGYAGQGRYDHNDMREAFTAGWEAADAVVTQPAPELAAGDGDCAECDTPRAVCPAHARPPEVSRELADAMAVLAKVRSACERPAQVVGHTSGSRVVNGDYLARHLLDIIKRAGLPS